MMITSALGNGSVKKLPAVKRKPVGEPESCDVGVEDRLDGRQVEAAAGQMLMGSRDRDRDRALRTADVDHAAVVAPREFGGDRLARRAAEATHRGSELRKLFGIGI